MFRIALFFFLLLGIWTVPAHADNLPSAAQVERDSRAAVKNGNVIRFEIDGSWKLERESGFDFANLAKQAIIADKQNPDGSKQQFNALAIYQRGAPNDPWRFDRLFSYGFKSLDGDAASGTLDAKALHALTLTAMRASPGSWTPVDPRNVYRIDAFEVVSGSIKQINDTELSWEIEGQYVINDTQQYSDPGVKKIRYRIEVEGIQHLQSKEWILSKAAEIKSTDLGRQSLTRAQFDSLPNLADAPFDQLYFGDKK